METSSTRSLAVILRIVAVAFIAAYGLTILWPSGWVWHPLNPAYAQMVFGITATLGVFLWRAASDPLRNLSLIWFAVWSSIVHAAIMAVHAFTDPDEMGHLPGDVAVLLVVALVLGTATHRASRASRPAAGTLARSKP